SLVPHFQGYILSILWNIWCPFPYLKDNLMDSYPIAFFCIHFSSSLSTYPYGRMSRYNIYSSSICFRFLTTLLHFFIYSTSIISLMSPMIALGTGRSIIVLRPGLALMICGIMFTHIA